MVALDISVILDCRELGVRNLHWKILNHNLWIKYLNNKKLGQYNIIQKYEFHVGREIG